MDLGNALEQVHSWGAAVPVAVGVGLVGLLVLLTVVKVAWWAAMYVAEQLVTGFTLKWLTGWSQSINEFARNIPTVVSYTALIVAGLAIVIPAAVMNPTDKKRAVTRAGAKAGAQKAFMHFVPAAGGFALFVSAGHRLLLEYVPAGLYVTAQTALRVVHVEI